MDKWITINQIVSLMVSEDLHITRRSFWFYVAKGLFRGPEKIVEHGGGRAGVYNKSYLKRIRKVLKLRDKGWRLQDIINKIGEDR